MKIAYIILAHKNPQQLARLISKLNTKEVIFSIHIDITKNIEIFKNQIFSLNFSNVSFLRTRYKTHWGGFNTVRATIALLKSVLEFKPDNIIFISGQDYPLMSNDKLNKYLNHYKNQALIEYESGSLDTKIPNRTNRYYFADYFKYNKDGVFDYKKVPIIPRFLTKILPKRKFIKDMIPYTGRVWFILPLDIATFFVNEYKRNYLLKKFFKFTISSDEMYFQTLLLNSKYAGKAVNQRITFADYDAPNPIVWKAENIKLLKNQTIPFARKFDTNIDGEILDLIDKEILELD